MYHVTAAVTGSSCDRCSIVPAITWEANGQYHAICTAYSTWTHFMSSNKCISTAGPEIPVRPWYTMSSTGPLKPTSACIAYLTSQACPDSIEASLVGHSIDVTNTVGTNLASSPMTVPQRTISSTTSSTGHAEIALSPSSSAAMINSSSVSLSSNTISPTAARSPPRSASSLSRSYSRPDKQAHVVIGVTVPIVATLVFLVLLLSVKLSKIGNRKAGRSDQSSRISCQPYLQAKGELEAKEQGRHELNVATSICELDDTQIHEAPTSGETADVLQGRDV